MATAPHEPYKFKTLEQALEAARKRSIEEPSEIIFVIESRHPSNLDGFHYYATNDGFVRSWERQHAAFENGRRTDEA